MMSLLDDFKLLNLKRRNGLHITNASSTSLYSASRKCERMMREKFDKNKAFKYDIDRDMLIDKCLDKINTIEEFQILEKFIIENDCKTIIFTIDKTIKKFVAMLRKEAAALVKESKDIDNGEEYDWDD